MFSPNVTQKHQVTGDIKMSQRYEAHKEQRKGDLLNEITGFKIRMCDIKPEEDL